MLITAALNVALSQFDFKLRRPEIHSQTAYSKDDFIMVEIICQIAVNGFEAGATTKSEAKALVLENMGNSLMSVIRDMPLELVEQLSCALGAGFEMNDGRLSAVRFS